MLLLLHLVICSALCLTFVPDVQTSTQQLNLTTNTNTNTVLHKVERTPASTLLSLQFLQPNSTNNTTNVDNFYLTSPQHFHESLAGTNNETEGIGKFWSTMTKLNAPQQAAAVPTPAVEVNSQNAHNVATMENIGYIHFEPTESLYNEPHTVVESTNPQNMQEVLLHLFPQGVGDMFRFSHASEPATTTTKRPNYRNLGQAFRKLHEHAETTAKSTPTIVYGLEASISMEHDKHPGHREIIVEKITLEPPTQQFLSQADILRINKAATTSENSSTTTTTTTSRTSADDRDTAYLLVNDLPTDMDELMVGEEDNRIAESRNVHLVHTLNNLPTYVEQVYDQPVFDYNYNQLLGPMGEEIQQLQQASMAPEFLISYNPLLDVVDNNDDDVVVSDQVFGRKLNTTQHKYHRQPSQQPQQPTQQRKEQQQKKESSGDYKLEVTKSMEIPLQTHKETSNQIVFVTLETTTPITTTTSIRPSTPSTSTTTGASRTEVEIQKSINTRNAQITEQNGRLLEMHETIYDGRSQEGRTISHKPTDNYVSSTKKPTLWNVPTYYKPSTPQTYVIPYQQQQQQPQQQQQAVPIPLTYHYVQRPLEVGPTQKPAPYQLEKFVKKILEKHEPTQTERSIEHFVPHTPVTPPPPVATPVAVPVAVPVPVPVPVPVMPKPLASVNTLPLNPMQNYFLHKLLAPGNLKKPGLPKKVINSELKAFPFKAQNYQQMGKLNLFKNDFTAMDLYPPPPPPTNSNWFKGARYIYNTLPKNMAIPETAAYATNPAPAYVPNIPIGNEMNDDFRWRIGHVLKRSAHHLTPPKIEYGFKPPLIPSVKLDTSGQLVEPESLHEK